jgi:hypothetical protein
VRQGRITLQAQVTSILAFLFPLPFTYIALHPENWCFPQFPTMKSNKIALIYCSRSLENNPFMKLKTRNLKKKKKRKKKKGKKDSVKPLDVSHT